LPPNNREVFKDSFDRVQFIDSIFPRSLMCICCSAARFFRGNFTMTLIYSKFEGGSGMTVKLAGGFV